MANYILQELPEEFSDGKKIVYPKMQVYSLHDYDTVLKHMQTYAGSFSEGSMRAVIDALVSTMKSWMPLGHNIKIDGLGVFSLTLGFDTSTPSEKALAKTGGYGEADGQEGPKDKYRHICVKGINFKPDPQLIAALNKETEFSRSETGVVVPQERKYSFQERIAIAQQLIRENGFMTLTDYVHATGSSRAAASRDLRKMVGRSDSHITTRGAHSHKVWVWAE